MSRSLSTLRPLLPSTWSAEVAEGRASVAGEDRGDGAVLAVRTPRGAVFEFGIEPKARIVNGARGVVSQALVHHGRPLPAVVMTEYASPPLRRLCEEVGVGYLDTTGWVYLRDDSGLLFRNQGAERAPADHGRRRNEIERLDGPGASRIVRCLWDLQDRAGVRELAELARTSPGTVTKVLPTLERHGAVTRDSEGGVAEVDRVLLLERWIQDYRFRTTNSAQGWYLSPRGLARVLDGLTGGQSEVTVTGYHGARNYLPDSTIAVVPESELTAYASDPDEVANELGLRPAAPGAGNVLLVRPRDGSLLLDGPGFAPPAQVIADLLTMDGRYPELGAQVFEALTGQAWAR